MGNKLYILFEYLYLVMAALSVYVSFSSWGTDKNRAFLPLLLFSCFSSKEILEKK